MEKDIAIVYMVAGISSRFGGRIKQFANIGPNNETLIEYSINQAIKAGFTKIIFIVGNLTEKPFKEKFKNKFKNIPIEYALQSYDLKERDRPWGTADAISTIKSIINCPFVICNGDDIYGENTFKILASHLKNSKDEATIGYTLSDVIPEKGSTNRGIFQIKEGYVENLKEVIGIEKCNLKATNNCETDYCSMNIFALHKETVDLLDIFLKDFKKEHIGDRRIEALLPEFLSRLINQGKIKMKIYPTKDKWLGITNPEDEPIVREILKSIEK
jgi:NDP-sugar pyrophosphorylase family protein